MGNVLVGTGEVWGASRITTTKLNFVRTQLFSVGIKGAGKKRENNSRCSCSRSHSRDIHLIISCEELLSSNFNFFLLRFCFGSVDGIERHNTQRYLSDSIPWTSANSRHVPNTKRPNNVFRVARFLVDAATFTTSSSYVLSFSLFRRSTAP